MNLDTRIKQALIDINFVERYEKLSTYYSQKRTPKGQELDYFDGDFLMEIVELLGYKVQYDKQERFFHIELEEIGHFRFGFHFAFERGRLELIWVIYEGNKAIMGSPFTSYAKWLISRDYIILDPVISDYVDFRDVMKIAFEMYEDFKQAFLKAGCRR
ncbi:Uncharacterised protein [Streptococcus cristatus]|uniref:Uncharacterized protein n=2 Tax=Streptococcus cristatus TaxID=45634 RepID=A0A512AAK7_STRCR|nr:hypothetical protein [Streptococcus cristatus]AGK71094.1 hypothetical protein I872_05010 [Streptococcus cristatus AS 1.3089]GEN96727.1 hypothetical protein SOL01_06010 [Streptococcus cristatus]SQI47732.1 Uncharacterised protein [Streptococcus cristatus]